MVASVKRSKSLKLTVTPELHARLSALGDEMGISPATLASVAVGQFVAQQSRQLETSRAAVDAMVANLGPEVSGLLRTMAGEGKA